MGLLPRLDQRHDTRRGSPGPRRDRRPARRRSWCVRCGWHIC